VVFESLRGLFAAAGRAKTFTEELMNEEQNLEFSNQLSIAIKVIVGLVCLVGVILSVVAACIWLSPKWANWF
jgi:hypothetical protein